MENMPYQPQLDTVVSTLPQTNTTKQPTDWRNGLPVLTGSMMTLREMRVSDAASLFFALTTEQASRFISPSSQAPCSSKSSAR